MATPTVGQILQCGFDVLCHLRRRLYGDWNPAPQFLIEPDFAQRIRVLGRQRLQPHMAPFQHHWLDLHFLLHAQQIGAAAGKSTAPKWMSVAQRAGEARTVAARLA
jgi:hypothetical protein